MQSSVLNTVLTEIHRHIDTNTMVTVRLTSDSSIRTSQVRGDTRLSEVAPGSRRSLHLVQNDLVHY